jgi:(S)-sulfolactate dehydrogenase
MRGLFVATPLTGSGQWPRSKFIEQREAYGKTLGIVGLGSIGREVAKKASAFGFQCVAYDPLIVGTSVSIDQLTIPLLGLEKLLNQSAVVTLHLPLLDSTKGLFSGQTLDLMQDGAFLVNTSRGQIVDEKALADRLRSGRLGGAAMDVFAKEPAKDLSHFAGIENIFLTPHISGVTVESNDRVCDVVTRLVDQALGKFA